MGIHYKDDVIFIDNPDDLIDFATSDDFQSDLLSRIKLGEGFNLHFTLRGEQWRGQIDYRVGRFIYELQRDIFSLYNEISGDKVSYRSRHEEIEKLLVTIDVSEGSLDVQALLENALTQMVNNMSGTEAAVAAIIAIGIWCGKEAWKSYNERVTRSEEIAARLSSETEREETMRTAIKAIENSNSAITNLVAKMDNDDTIVTDFQGETRTFNADEIKNNLPDRPSRAADIVGNARQVWGVFQITKQDNKNFTFGLSASGIPLIPRALPNFSNNTAREEFFRLCQEQLSQGATPTLRLRLTLLLDQNLTIQNALIMEVLSEEPSDIEIIQDALSPLP